MIVGSIHATVRCDRCDRENTVDLNRAASVVAADGGTGRVTIDEIVDECLMNGDEGVFYDGGRTRPGWVHLCQRCFSDPDVEDLMAKKDADFAEVITSRRAAEGRRVARYAVTLGYFTQAEADEMEDAP